MLWFRDRLLKTIYGEGFRREKGQRPLFIKPGILGIVAFVLCVQGCGFRPMYAPLAHTNVNEDLAAVQIQNIPDRSGMLMRNELSHLLAPKGRIYPSRYTLIVMPRKTEKSKGIRLDASASISEITSEAKFQLLDLNSGKVVLKDKVFAVSSYSISPRATHAAVATPVAAETASDDAIRLVAKLISERVTAYLLQQQEK